MLELETDAEEQPDRRLRDLVALLMILVTLLGAVVAFLDTKARNREALADRRAQVEIVTTMSRLVGADRDIYRQALAGTLDSQAVTLSQVLDGIAGQGQAPAFARSLAAADRAASQAIEAAGSSATDGSYGVGTSFDFPGFYRDVYGPVDAAAEYQKAWALERDGWGSKTGGYLRVGTVLAVAVFLLGITLTVPARARRSFLWLGMAVALAAAGWTGAIAASRVREPVDGAIASYVSARVRLDVLEGRLQFGGRTPDQNADRASYALAIRSLTDAIDERPDYVEAVLARGLAEFELDLYYSDARGPVGSEAAQRDFTRATELTPTNPIGWTDLGAADFWLGDYSAALAANRRALSLRPDEPISNLNQALYLIVTGRDGAYHLQMERVRDAMAAIPAYLRNASLALYQAVFDQGISHRPQIAPAIATMREDVLRTVHQIDVSMTLTGSPTPRPVAATMADLTFSITPDLSEIDAEFDYRGMKTGEHFESEVFVNGARAAGLSQASLWNSDGSLTVPDGRAKLPVRAAFVAGQVVRVELYVEGNLLDAGEFTVPASSSTIRAALSPPGSRSGL